MGQKEKDVKVRRGPMGRGRDNGKGGGNMIKVHSTCVYVREIIE